MKKLSIIRTLLFLLLTFTFIACSKDDIQTEDAFSRINVELKSTSGDFDKVFIDIEDVQLKVRSDDTTSAWVSLNVLNQGDHNIFDLNEDSALLLVNNFELEATYIYQIRLVLGTNSFLELDRTIYNLNAPNLESLNPSNQVSLDFVANRIYDIVIDINIDQSIAFDEHQNQMVLNPQLYTEIRQTQY